MDHIIAYDLKNNKYVISVKDDEGYNCYIYQMKADENNKIIMSVRKTDNDLNPIGDSHIFPDEVDSNASQVSVGNPIIKHKPKKNSKGLTAEERLNQMIGLSNVKSEIKKIKALISKNPSKKIALNFAFTGNPGTGKTAVARLMAEILYNEGVISNNLLVEVDRSDLVGKVVGETAIKTHDVVKKAKGGVLFIDEAYSLKPTCDVDYGSEAIDALIADMENYKGEMCFILAGYKNPLLEMIDTNKGFKSRINKFVDFVDFTRPELKDIAKLMLTNDGYTIDSEALEITLDEIEKLRFLDDFGNARTVRGILEQLYGIQAERTLGTPDVNITVEDVNKFKNPNPILKVKSGTEELNELIGLESVKKQILIFKALLSKKKGNLGDENLNMCFYGNPGTGKTVVARIIANILYEEGILASNTLVETDRAGLVAGYLGQTADKTHKIVKSALNGVLFIDEAYSLADGGENDYGKEAIAALIADMENYRGKLCVILAGYKKPMEKMISLNPGFDSRIKTKIEFADYNIKELLQIASIMLKKKKYTITEDALTEIAKILNYQKNDSNFANARSVRNILESIYGIQALRTYNEGMADSYLIKLEDVSEYENSQDINFTSNEKEKIDYKLDVNEFLNYSADFDSKEYRFDSNNIVQCSCNIKVSTPDGDGEGSGFFISPNGLIATCAHVVNKAEKIKVLVNFITSGNQTITNDYRAHLIKMDLKNDVALIAILNSNIKFNYYALEVDEKLPKLMTDVVMGGYPFGGDRFSEISITTGRITSVNKDSYIKDSDYSAYLDLAGYPGSSGSGVVDYNTGKCIGVFRGCAVEKSSGLNLTMNMMTPIIHILNLINSDEIYESDKKLDTLKITEEDLKLCNSVIANDDLEINDEIINIPSQRVINCFREEENLYQNIHIIKGDITTFNGDVIVNAANKYLAPGGGLCGQIFKKAGFRRLKEECMKLNGCETGMSAVTPAFDLSSKYIFHAVGPNYEYDKNPEELLRRVYQDCFSKCKEYNIESIAFPSISTGIYKFPIREAAPIALRQIIKYSIALKDVYIYCYDEYTYNVYLETFERLKTGN